MFDSKYTEQVKTDKDHPFVETRDNEVDPVFGFKILKKDLHKLERKGRDNRTVTRRLLTIDTFIYRKRSYVRVLVDTQVLQICVSWAKLLDVERVEGGRDKKDPNKTPRT